MFRDSLLSQLKAIDKDKDNFDEISAKLDAAGNTLDYRKYAETLFEILFTGGILGIVAHVQTNKRHALIHIRTWRSD